MKVITKYFKSMMKDIFSDTNSRLCIQLQLFCVAASMIAVIMTLLNCVRTEYMLGLETGIGAAVSVLIYLYTAKFKRYRFGSLCIVIIFLALLTVFLVSGAVDGFAALWFCLYPFICLFILDMKTAILFSVIGMLVLSSFLWTPLQGILPPVYTRNFLLRFPLLYTGNFAFALALNGFYSYTYGKLLQMNRKFERLSNQDGLTKLSNRTYLEKYKLEFIKQGGSRLSAAMLDVDYFKQYNDTYGHLAGDEVLKSIAEQIMELLSDENSIAVRYGGEEFLILFPEYGKTEAAPFAEKLLANIRGQQIPHIVGNGYLSVSMGVSSRDVTSPEDFQELVGEADEALYTAKQTGRDRIVVYGS